MTWENYEHEDVFAAEREAYPREQYEADRAKLIAEGVEPRLIMSYIGVLSSMAWEAEMEREAEIWESYDEAWAEEDERQMREAYAELEREKAAERGTAAEVAERDETIELAELAEESAMSELAVFGCIEFEPQFNWHAKSTPEERGWSRAMVDIIAFEGAENAEALFELY